MSETDITARPAIEERQPRDGEGPLQPRRLAACTLGHLLSDSLANFVPPLWFTVQAMFGLNDRGLGLISVLLSTTTNFGQPVFGYLVDRYRLRNIIPVSLLLAAFFICCAGFAERLWLFVVFLMIGGLGISLFHPRGGALAAEASGSRRALGMSIFGAGGAVGFALASLAAPALHNAGLKLSLGPLQGFVLILPLGIFGVWLLYRFNPQRAPRPQPTFSLKRHLLPHLRPLAPLFLVMVLRSSTVVAFGTYIQVLQGKHGHSALFQGGALFSFVFGAALGGITGSHLSDRYGRRFLTVFTLAVCPPLLYWALFAQPIPLLILLFLAGATLRGAESVNIAQTQDLLPHGMSMASAISMGFTWGVSGFIAPIVGWISDYTGSLTQALSWTVPLPLVAALIALTLPTRPPAAPADD